MGSVRTSAPHVILPLAIVAVGVLFLLDNLGSLDATSFIGTWWPSVIVLLGLSMLPGRTMGFFFPGVVILLGVVFQLKHLELLPGDAWSYLWPALVVLLGLSMLARRLRSAGDRCDGAAQDVSVDRLDLSATFSQAERRIRSDAFTGGRASCSFGETVLDLTGTRLAGGRALLNVDVSFGR
ncbi:MAG: hypothetical protein FJ098_07835, partial [Deltaproteobacteria bacterium]|nr:hypothetical protein [Deltaproteobacteria bacterium]